MQILDLLQHLVLDLNNRGQKKLCHQLIDTYFPQANNIVDYDVLGHISLKTDYREMYLKCAERAMMLTSTADQLVRARINFYKALNTMNYPDQALNYIEQHLLIDPDNVEIWLEKAAALSLMNQKQQSEELIDHLIKKYPHYPKKLSFGFSGRLLRQGKFAEGVLSFLTEFKPSSHLFEKTLGMTKWTGQIAHDRKIYVEGEGGIGDEIINIRFFKNLENLGMTPILYSTWSNYRSDTISLFRRHGYDVIVQPYTIDTRELWTPMMTIPGYLNLTENDLWTEPYLHAQRNPKNQLSSNKFKIGIKCNGNPYFGQDEYRKIPLETMLKYIPNNCEIYYIDKTDKKDHPRVINLADRIDSWEDTLDFIDQMDCIVSSCTSLVHAAGAMNKTTIVVVPICEYYIWTSSRSNNSTPWYDNNFYVYKQKKLRSWDEPLRETQLHLERLIHAKSSAM